MILQWQGKSEQSRNGEEEEEEEERCVTLVVFFQVSLSYRFTINVSLYMSFLNILPPIFFQELR